MNTRELRIALSLLLAIFILSSCRPEKNESAIEKEETVREETGRYQIYATRLLTTKGGSDVQDLFLLDSQSGQVWIYADSGWVATKNGGHKLTIPGWINPAQVRRYVPGIGLEPVDERDPLGIRDDKDKKK